MEGVGGFVGEGRLCGFRPSPPAARAHPPEGEARHERDCGAATRGRETGRGERAEQRQGGRSGQWRGGIIIVSYSFIICL